jgi:hypothetical protein
MPMIVDPSAPEITPPESAVSPDGWLTATVDAPNAGVVLAVNYTAGTPLADAADVRKVRIVRQDPGAAAVPVRSADTAWAIEGSGTAYDHEAPLGVGVAYTAVPIYADGSTGPSSSVAVTIPEPSPPADVWIKSVDNPSLSARVTVVTWPNLQWAARGDQAGVMDSRYPAAVQDQYAASTSEMSIDAEGSAILALEELLTTPGVRLIQTRPGYFRKDMFVVFGDVAQGVDAKPDGARTYTVALTEVARPDTVGQPLRMPGWSYDVLADLYATYSAVASSFDDYASLSVNGAV